ncbi:MAG TPA: nuclear transport factor 2 family protein [Pyrinomonadaceae bacterium]|jgi:steroid delta-isomerase
MSTDLVEQASVEKVVADYFAAIRAMDASAWVSTFAADGVSYDPVGAPPAEGHKGLRQFFEAIAGAFEKIEFFEDHVFICGRRAAVKWSARGVGKSGREVTFAGIDVFEVNDEGKIQNLWGYWNPAAMMAQLQS